MTATTTTPSSTTDSQPAARPDRDKDRWEQNAQAAPDRNKDRWESNVGPDRDKDRWESNVGPDRDKDRWESNASGGIQRTFQPAAAGRWLLALGTMIVGLGVLMLSRATHCQELGNAETLDGAVPAL